MYFISLVIIGVMIFLNLFLAILLENFEEGGEDEESEDSKEVSIYRKALDTVKDKITCCLNICQQNKKEVTQAPSEDPFMEGENLQQL